MEGLRVAAERRGRAWNELVTLKLGLLNRDIGQLGDLVQNGSEGSWVAECRDRNIRRLGKYGVAKDSLRRPGIASGGHCRDRG